MRTEGKKETRQGSAEKSLASLSSLRANLELLEEAIQLDEEELRTMANRLKMRRQAVAELRRGMLSFSGRSLLRTEARRRKLRIYGPDGQS